MIGKDWTQLATLLNNAEDIDTIDSEQDSLFNKARVVLTKWKQKSIEKATTERLIQALQKIERHDIVNEIEANRE